jgi:predicted XRE-type DNA-binding protein
MLAQRACPERSRRVSAGIHLTQIPSPGGAAHPCNPAAVSPVRLATSFKVRKVQPKTSPCIRQTRKYGGPGLLMRYPKTGINAGRMAKRKAKSGVIASSGNVFADLGVRNADERQTKVRLAVAINQILQDRKLSQTAAGRRLKVNQPKVSALSNYQLVFRSNG